MHRILGGINLLAVVGMWAFSAWAWPRLPGRIPLHFGPDGTPDRWGPPTATNWFLLPTLVVALNLVLLAAGRWIRRDPSRINLPGGQRVDELPEAARTAVGDLMHTTLGVVQLMMNGVFILIQTTQYRVALGASGASAIGGVLLLTLMSGPVFLVAYFLRLQKALARR